MTATQRRLRAVFLCAFIAAGLILVLGTALLYLALPVTVQAQEARCLPVQHVISLIEERDLPMQRLPALQANIYMYAVSGRPWPIGPELILVTNTTGQMEAILVFDTQACFPSRIVPAADHERAMSAVFSEPI